MVNKNSYNAMIIILSSPSGAGKSSIAARLLELDSNISLSISATTRKPRSKEQDNVNYFFHDRAKFQHMIDDDQFLEYAQIYGNMYGTPRAYVESKLKKGIDVLFDIDSQGAYQIIEKMPENILSFFIMPPDIETLRSRIIGRAQDDEGTIEQRLNLAEEEMEHAKNYNYTIVNDDFNVAVEEVYEIILKERSKRINK